VIPNVLDFENSPPTDMERIKAFRHSIGLKPDDIMLLQPTRIVQRKGIEAAIQLVKELNSPQYKLVVSHEAGDEGFEYASKIKRLARESGVDIRFIDQMVADPFAPRPQSHNRFSLWEVYQAADFVTFPSLYEGFGNALLEAIYFKKPLLVNRYQIFQDDIEPKGFDVVKMDGSLTGEVVADIKNIIHDRHRREKMVTRNYRIAQEHYSYDLLRKQFASLISNLLPHQRFAHQECPRAVAGS
jgi:glycosyltransferase involved in cell wall biosynthesis